MPLDTAPRAPLPPLLDAEFKPPVIKGIAALAATAFTATSPPGAAAGADAGVSDPAAVAFDQSLALQLSFRREAGLALQAAALARSTTFRVQACQEGSPRILAICAPGDLMTNTPLEFVAAGAGAALDLLFILPDRPLPARVPDHDIAFCAVSEQAPEVLARVAPWLSAWPRTVLNRAPRAADLAREAVSQRLAGIDGVLVPQADSVDAAGALATRDDWMPFLLRPAGTHAGEGLVLVADRIHLHNATNQLGADRYNRTRFVDYRSGDRLYRKYRVALIGGLPFLCHMAISDHWMVHYLNAEMASHPERRAEEARAMAEFDRGFGGRHGTAFARIADRLGLDWVVIDCAEAPDGRLLFFEADVAAIVHAMDPPDIYPYKQAAMARVFEAFRVLVTGTHQAAPGGATISERPSANRG